MKKTMMFGAAAALFAGAAHAQSSVTLYGILDVGVTFVNNATGAQQYLMTSGNLQGSRWGLKGAEDLGGGLQAIFVTEGGFSVPNGRLAQGGDLFGRQVYVGLSSNQYGTLTLGRQYESVLDQTCRFAAACQWFPYFGAHPGDLDNMIGGNRVNNAIKYKTIDYAGLSGEALYSLGGNAGQFHRNQIWSLGGSYHRGPFDFGVAYLNVDSPNYSFFGNMATSNTSTSNMTGNRIYSGYASAKTQAVFAAGASYVLGASTFGVTYSNTQFKDLGALPNLGGAQFNGGSAKFHNVEANYKYQFTPSLVVGVAYDYTKGYGVNDARYQQAMLGADYFLSKRTDVYASAIYQHASGTDSTSGRAVANITSLSASSTSNQTAVIVGIRHKF
ncbi:porin [Paraburkholderia sp. BL17N1]|uniref:porin n=1 Tax=Paraburkholderia sp. BL17N1 TaxID=1938798 RepID=UPI000EAE3A8A|nr:porin [Paraburkholderia sp. BL17N1]